MKTKLYYFIIAFIIASCGPSAEEKAKIEQETIARIAREKYEKVKASNLYTMKNEFDRRLTDAKIELELAQDALRKIEEFQFLRTYEEKQEQLRTQMHNIADREKQIKELENLLQSVSSGISDLEYEGLVTVFKENGVQMQDWN